MFRGAQPSACSDGPGEPFTRKGRKTLLKRIIAMLVVLCGDLWAQAPMSDVVRSFVRVNAPVVALQHVRVIDGTGAAPAKDQTIILEGRLIRSAGSAANTPAPTGATALDLTGYTVIPGLVGMHDHMFYPSPRTGRGVPPVYTELAYSGPRLYLAGGVTSLRTTGSIEPYTDLATKKLIDSGVAPGPRIHITGALP